MHMDLLNVLSNLQWRWANS